MSEKQAGIMPKGFLGVLLHSVQVVCFALSLQPGNKGRAFVGNRAAENLHLRIRVDGALPDVIRKDSLIVYNRQKRNIQSFRLHNRPLSGHRRQPEFDNIITPADKAHKKI